MALIQCDGWYVEGASGLQLLRGEKIPAQADPVAWLTERWGCGPLVGHRLQYGRQSVGLLVVDEHVEREQLAICCAVATPYFAALAMRAKVRLQCAMVAHDLRRPLATLGLSLELLKRASVEPLRELERSRRAFHDIDDLVEDLLAFTTSRRRPRACFSIAQLIEHRVDALTDAAAARRLRFLVDGDDATVLGDEVAMGRAVGNALSNALQASPLGGTVRVVIEARGREVTVEVRDQGRGVPPELREKVFEPFFTTRSRGSGLGLAVLREVVEAHGGQVAFVDGPGGVIRLTLPCVPRRAGTTPVAVPAVRHA